MYQRLITYLTHVKIADEHLALAFDLFLSRMLKRMFGYNSLYIINLCKFVADYFADVLHPQNPRVLRIADIPIGDPQHAKGVSARILKQIK